MKKILTMLSLAASLALPALASDLDYAYRLPAELQTPGPQALEELTWQQGSTPLIQVEVLRRGKPVTADTNTTVRMIIGPSATSTYYVVTEQDVTTNTSYYVQWPTVGTNSLGTNTTAQAWWYTIYFERSGHRYWTGNGDLYIEETTSTATDGLTWQTLTVNSVAWSNVTGSVLDNSLLAAEFATKADTNDLTAASNAFRTADTALSNQLVAADTAVSNAFRTADTAVSNAFRAADTIVSNAFRTADTAVSNAFIAADGVLSGQLVTGYSAGDIVVSNAFIAADVAVSNALRTADTAVSNAFIAADGVLSGQLVTAYGAADIVVSNAFRTADTAVSNAFVAADTVVSNGAEASITARGTLVSNAFVAADTGISNAFRTADTAVSNAFVTADGVLSGQVATGYSTADTAVSNAFVAADGVVSGLFRAADTVISNGYVAQDTAISNAFRASDVGISNAFATADTAVSNAFRTADTAVSNAAIAYAAAGDTAVSNAFRTADTVVSNAFKAADTVVSNAFGTADAAVSNAFRTADTAISNQYKNADTAVSNAFRAADTVISNALDSRLDSVEGYTNAAQTAYGWGDHADAGYLTAGTNLFKELYVADRSKLNTNIAGLTGTYTGVVEVAGVSYTGVTVLVVGRTYAWGFTKQNAYGTATLSIGPFSLAKSTAGSASNYFAYTGTDTNLIIHIAGTGSSKSDVSAIYVKQITNGSAHISGDLDVGGTFRWDGKSLGSAATNESTDFDAAGSAGTVQTNLNTASNALHIAITNIQAQVDSATNRIDSVEGYTNYAFLAWGWGDWATNYLDWAMMTGTPDNVSDYGITDAYTKTESDAAYATTGTVGGISSDVDALNGKTSGWDTASTDASAATGAIAVIQSSTSLWNKAATDGVSATSAVAVIQSSTSLWNTAATDASSATGGVAELNSLTNSTVFTNTPAYTGALGNITINAGGISTNVTDIEINAGGISTNAGDISTNSSRIDGLTNGAALGATAWQPGDSVTNAVDETARTNNVLTSNAIPTTAAQVGAVGTNDVSVTNARPWDSPDYNTITNPPTIPSTNELASTNWVIAQGYSTSTVADLSGWSGNAATQPVFSVETIAINPTDVVGVFTQIADSYTRPCWQKTNYFVNSPSEGTWLVWTNAPSDARGLFGLTAGSPTGTYAAMEGTGTLVSVYSYDGDLTNLSITAATVLWKAGLNTNRQWQVTRDDVLHVDVTNVYRKDWGIAVSNLATAAYPGASGIAASNLAYATSTGKVDKTSLTNMVIGLTAGTAYDGAQGHSVSGQVAILNTNTAPLQSYLVTSNTADAALPKSWTNTGIATAVQITGGSPTTGATLLATNAAGQSKWSLPVGFSATLNADYNFSNAVLTTITWPVETFDYGNCFDGTTFTSPVNGLYIPVFMGEWQRVSGAATYTQIFLKKNGATLMNDANPWDAVLTGGRFRCTPGVLFLTNGATLTTVIIGVENSTNKLMVADGTFFSVVLVREIP